MKHRFEEQFEQVILGGKENSKNDRIFNLRRLIDLRRFNRNISVCKSDTMILNFYANSYFYKIQRDKV